MIKFIKTVTDGAIDLAVADMFVNLTKMSLLPLSKVWCIGTTNINYTARASLGNSWHWGRALKPLETVVKNLPAKWK